MFAHTKGQLILKCRFCVFKFFQKTNKNKLNWGIIVVKLNFFVCFLEELRIPKSPFEINWPLVQSFHNGVEIFQKSYRNLWGFPWVFNDHAILLLILVVTDRSRVLPFCPNRTSQLKFCLPNRTEQNQTHKNHIKSLDTEP